MKNELEILKNKYINAKTEKEKEAIDIEIQRLVEADGDIFAQSMIELARETADNAEDFLVKEKLSNILPFISVSYISKTYFNKSRHWFYQKLNGNIVNGKQARFSESEMKILQTALKELSRKLDDVSVF